MCEKGTGTLAAPVPFSFDLLVSHYHAPNKVINNFKKGIFFFSRNPIIMVANGVLAFALCHKSLGQEGVPGRPLSFL